MMTTALLVLQVSKEMAAAESGLGSNGRARGCGDVSILPSLLLLLSSCRGYTRKELFANMIGGLPWTPLVENWNGR
jgi:hypothetical protein